MFARAAASGTLVLASSQEIARQGKLIRNPAECAELKTGFALQAEDGQILMLAQGREFARLGNLIKFHAE